MALRLSGIAQAAKKGLILANGRVTRSAFYLTNLATGEMITLCMPPEVVKARTETNFRTWNIIEKGEVKLPKGERLTQLGWEGILPGANILAHNFVNLSAWEKPTGLVKTIVRWRENGDKIKVLITQTPINMTVYIKSFDYEMSGGQGNIKYDIEFIAAKEMKIMTVEEADQARQQEEQEKAQQLQERAAQNRTGEMVQQVDNAWELAQVITGNGGNWQDVATQYDMTDPTEGINGRAVIWG